MTMVPSAEPREVVQLDLSAGSIHTTLVDGAPHIVLKPAIEDLGLSYAAQYRKLQTRSWASVAQTAMQVPGDDQVRSHITVPVRTFLMLLANVNENRVKDEVRPTLVAFQNETADAIESYWTQGGAINPRASEEQLDSLISRAKQQAEVLAILTGVVDSDWLETKGRMLAARVLGEEPELDPLDIPMYVPDFLNGKGLNRRQVESVQSWFGRRAAALYEAEHGERPGKRQSDLPNGSVRETYAWTARHLGLFEETWDRYYADQFPTGPAQGELGGAA
ncbi:phage antirepressor N-terminal domain-containing protein [Streptomyces sp. NPDC003300]|uniref:phage antirepressor N-terminal domain-containing protein n=1 Tax=unclassified Streptomyces TaxID=2593676 RepID=UPI0033AA4250